MPVKDNISPGLQKAAILLMAIGEQEAAEIMKHMEPREVQKLGSAMSRLRNIAKEEVDSVINSFVDTVERQASIGHQSDEYVRSVIAKALGEEKAEAITDRILSHSTVSGLEQLKWLDARTVAGILANEHRQIVAIVLSYLESDQAAGVLAHFPDDARHEVIMRIATLDAVHPAAIEELNRIMETQFATDKFAPASSYGGLKTAADVLNYLDVSSLEAIIAKIKEMEPDLGAQLEDLMFVFEDLMEVDDRGIQALMREVSTDALVIALKGTSDGIKQKIFANMSKRAAEMLREDLEAKGPVKVSEVELAQKEIISVARRLAESGEISLGGKGGEEYV
ncbi:MAG: flagellar motor switch protein FliG [Gammaproteobacteria bacterium]|nr:MAG: flagellar motor switch protein FliG [Gammaproteobacteria bacterium]TND06725.1 MAG: flagellar motor switch protein FliG [Gammaproteobacteria bacterium]